jgi:hypothetical protein
MAVASFVIGGAYVLTNRTLANSQQAQEHSEALKVAEGQVEQLRLKVGDLTANDNPVCFHKDSGVITPFPGFEGSGSLPGSEDNFPEGCKGIGLAGYYKVGIIRKDTEHDTVSPQDDTYVVSVTWPGPTGGDEKISLSYRAIAP